MRTEVLVFIILNVSFDTLFCTFYFIKEDEKV